MHLARFLPAVGLLSVWPAAAAAGEIDYDGAAGCPTREAVVQRTTARAPHARDARVSIKRTSSAFVGEVTVGGGEAAVERKVEGRTCDAVVDALVLVLALDRGATDPEPRVDEPGAAAPSSASSDPPLGQGPAPAASSGEPRAAVFGPTEPQQAPLEIGVGALGRYRMLDRYDLRGGELFGEVTRVGLPGWLGYRASGRVSAVALASKTETTVEDPLGPNERETKTRISFVGGAVEGCGGVAPVSTKVVDFALFTCGALNLGSAGADDRVLWLDTGVVQRASLQLGRKQSTRAFVELSGGVLTRLGEALPQLPQTSDGQSVAVRGRANGLSLTVAFGAGIVLP